MKKNKNASFAKLGMNKDMASDSLQNQSYTFAINMNMENSSGNLLKLKSEHSNLLASKFKIGYKVIGFESDINNGSTYFFLTNPTTGVSEIGVIIDNADTDLMSDLESKCKDCDFKRVLQTPLEDLTQTEYLTYNTIVEDSCNQCLNFDVRYPIKKVIIKNEKSGIKIFFSDNLNPPRYLDLNRLGEYAYTGEIICDTDETVSTCLACDKLRMFPIYMPIRISPEEQVLGGNLQLGQYSFYAAYANRLGDEMSEYTSLTNPVSIFDENNKILTNEEKGANTNYAIKLNVDELDKKFAYYKIVVSYSNIIDGGTRHYEVGVFPSTTQNVLLTTLSDKEELSLNDILIPNPNIQLLEGLATSNNYLFGYGVTKEKEWNLQPVVNLMGGFFKWQTQIGKEDLYEDGVNNSLYKGYMRDEVYPLSIAFITDFGYTTARLPLIARPATATDVEAVNNLDSQSIAAGINSCDSNLRTERWQYYNTASEIGTCASEVNAGSFEIGVKYEITFVGDTDFTLIGASSNTVGVLFTATGVGAGTGIAQLAIPTNIVIEPVTKICSIDSVVTTGPGTFIIAEPVNYTGLEDFINDTLEVGTCIEYPFCSVIDPGLYADCSPTFTDCDTPVLDNQFLQVNNIVGEIQSITYRTFPDDYSKLQASNICFPHSIDSSGNTLRDDDFEAEWVGASTIGLNAKYWRVYTRTTSSFNNSPNYTEVLTKITDLSSLNNTYYHIYESFVSTPPDQTPAQLTSFDVTCTSSYALTPNITAEFTNKLHKTSLWFEVEAESFNNSFIFELTKLVDDDVNYGITSRNEFLRLSLFDSKTSGTSIYCNIINLDDTGLQLLADVHDSELITTGSFVIGNTYVIDTVGDTDFTLIGASSNTVGVSFTATGIGGGTTGVARENFIIFDDGTTTSSPIAIPNSLYFTVDAPIAESNGSETGYYSIPLKGCFSAAIRPLEVDYIEASYDSITFDKVQKYVAQCNFEVPIVPECGVVPYKYGEFAYWQSERIYPDNAELYNSSTLEIEPGDFTSNDVATEFQTKYTSGTAGNGKYILTNETNFVCKPVRHFKFPDNAVSPFMYENEQAGFVKSIIYPLGVTVDENVINDFLNIAVNNGLITQEQRDSIVGYEIFRGDRTLNKGIVAKGLAYDMYNYEEKDKSILFPNFPYNSLGDNKLLLDDARVNNVEHPYDSDSNYNFTFHSPDTEFIKPTLPTEMKIEGYTFGKSKGVFDEVEGHPKYVILGSDAKRLAATLATAEVVAEAIVASSQAFSNYTQVAGLTNTVFDGAWVSAPLIAATIGLAGALYKYGRYKYEWLNTFRNLGSPENFAYYYTSVGEYNYLKTYQTEGESLRSILKSSYLPSGRFTIVNEVDGEKLEINNVDREHSVFLTIGAGFPITYPANYKSYDNVNTNVDLASRFVQSTTLDCSKGRSKEFIKNIASPYISLKNYLPSQYGDIDNINWLTTGYRGDLKNPSNSCLQIFGGDVFISRHTLKRKTPMFLDSAIDLASRTPFNYRAYSNLGEQPRYYANFLSPDDITLDRGMPDISTEYKFDCLTGNRDFYVKNPSKFYLYYYGIPSFLTETTINTNYRIGRPELKNLFYPLVGDYVEWTQEKKVSIKERNQYFYDSTYSSNTRVSIGRTLPATYDKVTYDNLYDAPNGVIYSLPDNNENELTEPWLIFRPLDKYEFSSSYGKLIELRGIETQQMLGRFENQSAIFNAVDVLVDGITENTAQLGTGGIFARRPVTFADTDLGYAGSQSFDMVSNEFGHFYPDAKRGQIFQILPGGKGITEISSLINNQPSGMKNWFKEHLPFKVLNSTIENFEDIDVDNPYNGVGITMGWDSRYKRVFLTKKDYKPLKPLLWACGEFYNPDIANYQDIIDTYISNGYTYEGIEDCRLKFKRVNSEVGESTDIYAILDSTSMNETDGAAAVAALEEWHTNLQINNPTYTGNLYIIPALEEEYLTLPRQIYDGTLPPDVSGTWGTLTTLPPNFGTGSWVPPTDLLLLAFIDEVHAAYHDNILATGFDQPPGSPIQPSTVFFTDYQDYLLSKELYTKFKPIIYPIFKELTGRGGAFGLHLMAAYEGKIMTQPELDAYNIVTDMSLLLTENPYAGALIPGTNPPEYLQPLKDIGWTAVFDKLSPATNVFSAQQFQDDLDGLVGLSNGELTIEYAYEDLDLVGVNNTEFFEDVSWTLAYSLTSNSWMSFYDFKPNYYINHNNYFQTGVNNSANIEKEFGLWSHLLTNKSFGVFYGTKYELGFEYPIINNFTSKTLESIELWTEALRYHSEYDFAYNRDINFNKLIISNHRETTGELRLVPQKTLRDIRNYPKSFGNYQEILMTNSQDRWKINYLYNRVDSEYLNQPIWNWDVNQITKTLNNNLVKFKGKKVLERLKGNFFLAYLGYDTDSRFEVSFKWAIADEDLN